MTLTAIILLVLKASIILSVFAIGLKATFADTLYLFVRPHLLIRVLLSMKVLMPMIAVVIVMSFDIHPAVKIALAAISVSPIPPILPNKALKAGGREDYTIGLLVAAAVLSIVTIPVVMELFERITGIPLAMRAAPIGVLVLVTILAPLLAGITVRRILPALADRVAKPLALVAVVLLVLSALPVLIGSIRQMFSLVGDGTILSLGGFAVAGIIFGHLLGGPDPEDRPVLALATSMRHPGIALAIAHANFPEQKLAICAVFLYLILSGILTAVYLRLVKRERRGSAPVETEKPAEA
jgi:BASS family bile acid:Na+ symporter